MTLVKIMELVAIKNHRIINLFCLEKRSRKITEIYVRTLFVVYLNSIMM